MKYLNFFLLNESIRSTHSHKQRNFKVFKPILMYQTHHFSMANFRLVNTNQIARLNLSTTIILTTIQHVSESYILYIHNIY